VPKPSGTAVWLNLPRSPDIADRHQDDDLEAVFRLQPESSSTCRVPTCADLVYHHHGVAPLETALPDGIQECASAYVLDCSTPASVRRLAYVPFGDACGHADARASQSVRLPPPKVTHRSAVPPSAKPLQAAPGALSLPLPATPVPTTARPAVPAGRPFSSAAGRGAGESSPRSAVTFRTAASILLPRQSRDLSAAARTQQLDRLLSPAPRAARSE